jgi:aldehyde:ferredoxin oxidoreductase
MNDGGRAAARSGLGGVMGSKNLKAIACGGSQKPGIFEKAKVEGFVKEMGKEMKTNPSGMYQVLSRFGTPGAVVMHLAQHASPIKNWGGDNIGDFPEAKWAKVGWEGLEKYTTKKYACPGCPIGCGHWMKISSGKYKVEKGHKPEYETLAMFGSNCLNDDMESIIYINELCNLYGFDTISAGGVVSFAIECYENGILTKKDTEGLELTWGNADAIISLLNKMGKREGIGDLLAEGAKVAAEKIGKASEKFAMHVGGELVPAHDPREAPGWGATYVSDPAPARHTRGGTQFAEGEMGAPQWICNMLGIPVKLEKYNPKDKGKFHAVLGGWQHLVNTSGACLFATDGLNFPWLGLMKAVTGWDLTVEEIIHTGQRISTLLHAFNLREGFKPGDFKMPPRLSGIPPFKVGLLKDITIDFEGLKKQYYEAMGFDTETGKIRKDRIEALGLKDILS